MDSPSSAKKSTFASCPKVSRAGGICTPYLLYESYDFSLPPVFGNRDQLIQNFFNLVKNAAEAVDETRGDIELTTQHLEFGSEDRVSRRKEGTC